MYTNQKEIKVLNEQMFATILFIGTLFISLSLTYDAKQKISGKKRIYNDKSAKYTSIFNRIIVVFIVLFYIQIDNENIDIARERNKSLRLLNLQKIIEFVTLCTALAALYISIQSSPSNSIVSTENPNI